jgi:O-antigen ligase
MMSVFTFKNQINLYSLYTLSFALSFHKKAIPILIILFLVTSLLNGNYNLKNRKKTVLFFALLYLAYLVGLFYSENFKYGLSDMETKLSLLIFPIAFWVSNIDFKATLNVVLKWFVIGLVISGLICLLEGIYQFVSTGEESELLYAKLSIFHHASYYSMYLNFGLIVVYYLYIKEDFKVKSKANVTIALSVFFSILIVLLSSKMGIISMLITQVVALIYYTFKYKKYIRSSMLLLFIVACLTIVYNASHTFSVRMDEFVTTISSGKASKVSTTGVRVYAWETAIELIKEKPVIGYGTGDVKNVLVKEYIKKELTILAEKELNPHNQFLQTAIAIGLLGFLILILSLILPMIYSIQKGYYLYVFFIALFIINILTESMLETQSGVIYFAFFNTLLFVAYFNTSERKEIL